MPDTEEKNVRIPESVTINGTTYMVKDTPELQQFVKEVARVEKSKLYTQFENLRTQIQNLGHTKVETPSSNIDIDSIIERMSQNFVTKDDLKTMLPEAMKQVIQPVLTATEEKRQSELKEYRERLIRDNIATCIPELVKGETKEELDASLQNSIRLRSFYPTPSSVTTQGHHVTDPLLAQQFAAMAGEQPQTPTPQVQQPAPANPAPAPSAPAAPRRPSPEVTAPKNIKSMPMSEFEAKRASLLAELESTYGA